MTEQLSELAQIKSLLSELTDRVLSLERALSPSWPETESEPVSIAHLMPHKPNGIDGRITFESDPATIIPKEEIEPSGTDEFVDIDKLVEEYKDLTLAQLRKRAIKLDYDPAQVSEAKKETLLKNVFKEETGHDWPKTFMDKIREINDNKLLDERDLGFGNLPQLVKFATEVRGLDFEQIKTLDQEELYQLLTKKTDTYTLEELQATPKPRLLNIAKSLSCQATAADKKDIIIEKIINKQTQKE